MKIFSLPASTEINRVVPKNSFDKYTTSKQKKLFAETIDKIRWANKLSHDTVNLVGKEVKEIQVFEISLKKKADVSDLLNIIDRAIPYHIIFIVLHGTKFYLSASYKHVHPTNENTAVIDWTFKSDWAAITSNEFALSLKTSLDYVFVELCKGLSGKTAKKLSISELIAHEQKLFDVRKSISDLQAAIKKQRQFNKKVELNLALQEQLELLSALEQAV